ncbi:Rieske (2Fe-2S) protein [Haloechinothrix halophila]|uniref:Rieske (2Fe-2S) protein n=1 Tax=Haloechinothrix halophila TaxID=1069073 RepID=UPI000416D914|nr:Rieske (2Fe-2S) protein [Haloechinothrix halophila]
MPQEQSSTETNGTAIPRRAAVAGVGALAVAGVAGVAACGNGDGGNGGGTGGDGPDPGTVVGKASDVQVGGGAVFEDAEVVVTQPSEGEYQGFSAVCTHQGCIVDKVEGGTINCACHGSKFNVADGSVAQGPASDPLPKQQVKVNSAGEIVVA